MNPIISNDAHASVLPPQALAARSEMSCLRRDGAKRPFVTCPVQYRHALLLADRTHDVGVITPLSPRCWRQTRTSLEIEQAFRHSAAAAYLVATTEGFEDVLGLLGMLAAVGKAGVTSAENRAALAGKR